MKRMYVTLGVMFLLVVWAISCLAQNKPSVSDSQADQIQKRLQLREEMHRRMIDKLMNGNGPDEGLFEDLEKMAEDMMKDSFSGMDSFAPTSSNYQMEWKETAGGRTLAITPKSPDQKLDINVNNGMITIKGSAEQKSQYGNTISQFNNSFNVPGDCDPSKVKMDQKDGKILLNFPFRTAKTIQKRPEDQRKPLPKSEDDVVI
ncbi:Hsp20/alpha crystallin family protein [Peredibacter sp. HCB2-198]|uniref:Hsp20/alpha crystallin family protein n=1 Tax=Peredibacter sp. HCB2-198 TaxID=3383025 RepID=UPI0038B58BC0